MTPENLFVLNVIRILKLWNHKMISPDNALHALIGVVAEYNTDKESE